MSANPETRLQAHNAGKVRSTKSRKPYKFILIEEFHDQFSARKRKILQNGIWPKSLEKENCRLIRRFGVPSPLPTSGRAGGESPGAHLIQGKIIKNQICKL